METDRSRALRRIELRYVLTDLLDRPPRAPWSVKAMVQHLTSAGFDLGEHPSKMVSDVLRTEVNRGRVRRMGWGTYQASVIPGSTRRRIRKRARARWAELAQ